MPVYLSTNQHTALRYLAITHERMCMRQPSRYSNSRLTSRECTRSHLLSRTTAHRLGASGLRARRVSGFTNIKPLRAATRENRFSPAHYICTALVPICPAFVTLHTLPIHHLTRAICLSCALASVRIRADSLLSLSAPALTHWAQQAQLHPPIANAQTSMPRNKPHEPTYSVLSCAQGRTAAPRCRCHACGARPTSSAPNGGHASPGHARR